MRNILLIFFLSGIVACTQSNQFYVSNQGNDSNNGTEKQPFLTVKKARDVVREKRLNGDTSHFSILIKEGDYYFTQTIELNDQDKNIIISSQPEEKVRFTGGISIDPAMAKSVSGTEKATIFTPKAREHIRMVKLRELGINNYGALKRFGFSHPFPSSWMELFINGKPCHLSRWPNDSTVLLGTVIEKGSNLSEGDSANIGGTFNYPGNRPSGWKTSDDIWVFGYFRYGWADDAVKLASIDTLKKTFTTAQAHRYGFYSGKPYNTWYAYNIPEEIDAPGEYYIDRPSGILYFYDPGKIEKLEVSVFEKPFIAMNKSSNITIEGISFECSRGIAVDMKSTNRCLLKDCTIQNIGAFAANISNTEDDIQGKDNGLFNCTIAQTGTGGVHLFGGNRQTLDPARNYVENCSIHDFNRIAKTYCAGVEIRGVGNRISHCEIFNGPHAGILLSGNDHLIEYNNIHDMCLVTDDVGALYYGRNPSMRGHLVRYNYFHDLGQTHRTTAVYHDDGACGMKVFGNIFYKAGTLPVLIGGGSDNPYYNNIFIDSPVGIKIDNRLQAYDWAKPWVEPGNLYEKLLNEINYSEAPYCTKYPELANYWNDNPALPKRNVVDKNIFIRVEEIIRGDKKFLEFTDNNYITNEDPGFENEKEQNFKLKESSEIFTKVPGFQAIPFDEIGIKK